jgi:ABC-type lipoprotein release transport system permease subunit
MIAAIAIGLFAGIFFMAFMQGLVDARLKTATKSELAHLQVHAPHFSENKNIEFYISDSQELLDKIAAKDSVVAVSRRLIAEPYVMAAHGTGGGILMGIEPDQEKKVTDISERLVEGTYLEKTSRMPPILVGQKLAKKLKLKISSKLNVQIVDRSGHLSSKGYRVAGIYKTASTSYDETHLFVNYTDMKEQLGMGENTAHEIAILLNKADEADLMKPSIQKIAGNIIVQTWKEISPEMSLLTGMMGQFMYIFVLIILIALCFGIINTMLMSVMERTKEIGMLMAVGMNKRKIFKMIILEAVMLTITGGVIGIIIGTAVTTYLETTPINLSFFSEGLDKYGFASLVYTSLTPDSVFIISILVVITGILSAIYPARKALKLNPAEATRTD